MNVSALHFSPQRCGDDIGDVAVVIDVLRATTTIATALANGARDVRPTSTVDEALRFRDGAAVLLAGEINSEAIPGFDLGNSPLQCTRERVAGASIVFRTTNGTQVLTSLRTPVILCAAFVNVSAVVRAITAFAPRRIALVCAGQEGRFSLEDHLCAGAIADALAAHQHATLEDDAAAARLAYNAARADLPATIRAGVHARALIAAGHGDDVEFASSLDRYQVVPRLESMRIVASD